MPSTDEISPSAPRAGLDHRHRRHIKDVVARYLIGFGGVSVIFAIVLIFFYLLYIVFPIFVPADMKPLASYATTTKTDGHTLHLAVEEQNVVGLRVTDSGRMVFFKVADGKTIKEVNVAGRKRLSAFIAGDIKDDLAFGFTDGSAMVVRHKYDITYPDNVKHVEPVVEYPLGEKAIQVDPRHKPLKRLAVMTGDERSTILALTNDNRLLMVTLSKSESLLSLDEEAPAEITLKRINLPTIDGVDKLLIDPEQHTAYIVELSGNITAFNISDPELPVVIERIPLVSDGVKISSIGFLTGGISLLVGGTDGSITQWFPVRKDGQPRLTRIRQFDTGTKSPITDIATEQRRKGFVSVAEDGKVAIYHSTARRTLVSETISDKPLHVVAISPRADVLLAEDQAGEIHSFTVHNEHPEVSWSVLWDKVWYESYDHPDYTWQSSSASNDFEPKFSLVPLVFGTLKGAFYAMLFAIPLAIFGAIYTAYFMAPKMRAYVKPTIEIMEALPTVILGFLAGLWLAPFVENRLPAIFSMMLLLPLGTLLVAYSWHRLPKKYTGLVPEGWQAALLVPVLVLIGLISVGMSDGIERLLFGGDMRHWLSNVWGLSYDQRNSLVVGIAMGVAVIPTIFSIAEDAIFSVPKHLTFGSLALGATFWQTLTRVVLLTASPGIFSAVMIGLGRAVGETMIVLMATGNTPVMDFSIFQGMRTLSANIAVEMPESEVNSTHFRILFLAALVLFLFTFLFNTVAEIVRQRLRQRYSSL